MRPNGLMLTHALVVDHDDLAGFDVTYELRADDVQLRRFREASTQAAGALGADAAEDQRANA